MRIFRLVVLLLLAAAVSASLAGAAPPQQITGLTAWTVSGPHIALAATVGGRTGVWTETFGSANATLLRAGACAKEEEIDQLAPGPNGSWSCLERGAGNTERFDGLGVVTRAGASRQVAAAGGPIQEDSTPVDSIPFTFGDGSFLGYLHVTKEGVVQLFRIPSSGRTVHVADLAGVTPPLAVAFAGGTLALLEHDGSVAVVTTSGAPVASIPAHAREVAFAGGHVVVRTQDRHVAVYTLQGRLLHSFPLGATGAAGGLDAFGRYAVYIGAGKALRAVNLATGVDRVVSRAGRGSFFNGVRIQAPGVVVPVTQAAGKQFFVTLRFIPTAALRAAFG